MSKSFRGPGRTRTHEKKKDKGRIRTTEERLVMDDLEDQITETQHESEADEQRIDPRDDEDGDEWMHEGADYGTTALGEEEADGDADVDPAKPPLRAVFRGAVPRLLFRVDEDAGVARVRCCFQPRGDDAVAFVREVKSQIEAIFAWAQASLAETEWRLLLWGGGDSLTQRLRLIRNVALRSCQTEPTRYRENAQPGPTESSLNRKAKNLGMVRYERKLLALPDGQPLSLRLLLADRRRIRAAGDESGLLRWKNLHFETQIDLLKRALEIEAALGTASADDQFGELLLKAANENKIKLVRPQQRAVAQTRKKLKLNALEHLFPNRPRRQQQYDAAKKRAAIGAEERPAS